VCGNLRNLGHFPLKNPPYTWRSKKNQIEKLQKITRKNNLTGPRLLSNQDMNVTTVLTHFTIDEGSLFVLFHFEISKTTLVSATLLALLESAP
jgi:hypothetical protein